MTLSILILCIVFMTSFNRVASSNSSQVPSNPEPLLDFGFLRLIQDLVDVENDSANREAIFAIFAEVDKQIEQFNISRESFAKLSEADKRLYPYITSASGIQLLYDRLKNLLEDGSLNNSPMAKKTLIRQYISSEENGLSDQLSKFRSINSTGLNLMDLFIENIKIKERTESCWYKTQSAQYKIFTFYHELAIIIAQAYALRIYAYNSLDNDPNKYILYRINEKYEYEEALGNFQKSAVSALNSVSRLIRSCGYAGNEEGQKYIELKWLFNPIMINEGYLSKDGKCWESCADYRNTSYENNDILDAERCPGRLYDCFLEPSDVCHSVTNYHKRYLDPSRIHDNASLARYEEKMDWCMRKELASLIEDRNRNGCDMCICYCGDYQHSDIVRTFSLRAVVSDTSKNRVITGIKFVEKNQMIYLQIQEGELKSNGTIDKSTVKWQPVDEFDHESSLTSPNDFFTITYDKKSVNLDTLFFAHSRVLTGIGLCVQGSHLALKIRSHGFNYSTGILEYHDTLWLSHNSGNRKEITLTAPDNPTYMNQSVAHWRMNTFVTFRKTDYQKDGAQTTVPFIDALSVVSDPPVPFSGAGLYYSGQTGYGGFIGLKAFSYDLGEAIGN